MGDSGHLHGEPFRTREWKQWATQAPSPSSMGSCAKASGDTVWKSRGHVGTWVAWKGDATGVPRP